MDPKAAEQAITWVRSLVSKNNNQLPDWSTYKDHVKSYLDDPYNMPFKMPQGYQYAYLRVKGLSHADACERMGLEVAAGSAARPQAQQKESWWKFW